MSLRIPLQVVPSTEALLAVLDLAAWGLFTYKIPASGTEGYINDLHNAGPVTLYLWTTDSAVSPLLGFL